MNFVNTSRYWVIIILVIFLTGCAPETTQTSPPLNTSQPTLEPSPQPTSAVTLEVTPTITVTPAATKDCVRGDYVEQIESGGQSRQYRLHIPPTYDPQTPTALVLGFHGANSKAERFEIYSRFSRVADREGFIAAYPQALGASPAWNTSPGSTNPDLQFIRDLLDHLETRCNIDSARIYASGASNGGGLANRLACDLADRIAAIGTVSGAFSASESCDPARPVAVFAVHGTADPVVPYNGIPEWASAWAERNDCASEPEEIVHNIVISEKRWSNCRAGADVVLYTIAGGEHEWPSDLIDVAQIFWDFFEQHPVGTGPS